MVLMVAFAYRYVQIENHKNQMIWYANLRWANRYAFLLQMPYLFFNY